MENSEATLMAPKGKKAKSKKAPLPPMFEQSSKDKNERSAAEVQQYRDEAWELEMELESHILRDAVFAAHLALQELMAETYHGQPYERRRGLRLKEKALKVERAFNRLRALRKGDLLPVRHEDDW